MNTVKDSLLQGEVSIGTMMQLGHPGLAEILANAGFSWIAVDMEHSDIDVGDFCALCRGMYGRGALPLARVPENDTLIIRQVLDAGAAGVIVPLVSSAAGAAQAVAAAKYPPEGVRGHSFHRANDYGVNFTEDVQNANGDTLVIPMIETREGVENVAEILAVDGVDGIFMGPYDLSGSYGVIGQLDHPLVTEGIDRCVEACKRAGKAAGTHIAHPSPEIIKSRIEAGFTFLGLGYDSWFVDHAARGVLGMVG